jgi:hypothetical protein
MTPLWCQSKGNWRFLDSNPSYTLRFLLNVMLMMHVDGHTSDKLAAWGQQPTLRPLSLLFLTGLQ